jgi:hypothetical protein
VGSKPGKDKKSALLFANRKLHDRRETVTPRFHIRSQNKPVWSGDQDRLKTNRPDPRNGDTVVESNHQLHRHCHLPSYTFYDPYQMRKRFTGRHEVDETNGAVLGVRDCLQNKRLFRAILRGYRVDDAESRLPFLYKASSMPVRK